MAEALANIAPANPTCDNIFQGLLEKENGLFHNQVPLKHLVTIKKLKNWKFVADDNIKRIKCKSNGTHQGTVMLGRWCLDSITKKFTHINNHWLKENPVKICHTLIITDGEEGMKFRNQFNHFLMEHQALTIDIKCDN